MFAKFAGVHLMALANRIERGIQMLKFRTASGIAFALLGDRAMDMATVEGKVRAIG